MSGGKNTPALEMDGLPPLRLSEEGPSKKTGDAIRDAVRADLKPVSSPSVGARIGMVTGIAFACAALVVISFGNAGLSGLRRNALAVVITGVAAALTAVFVGGSLSRADGWGSQRSRSLLVATVITGWTLYTVAGITDQALGAAVQGPAIGCCVRSLVAGGLGLAALLWVWRKTDPWSPRFSGALMGACAGAIASAGVGIPCPSDQGGHLLMGHWVAVPLLAALGALSAKRILAP